ncbi:MAG: BON domain-containing protein [Proteobacteria bacterium]|nr:BON domain-containing protein [Pseudomonadota bacterium]
MRFLMALVLVFGLSGCTALMVGGGASGGGYQVDRDERSKSHIAADAALSTSIMSQYAAHTSLSTFNIGVRTTMSAVTLSGTVDSYAAREIAEQLAIDTNGVKAVNNQISVRETE